jgi:GABA permease
VRRYLVVGNQTLGSPELLGLLYDRSAAESTTFHILVPMRHVGEGLFWSEGGAHAAAQARLDEMIARFRDTGFDVTGEVGDTNPVAAVDDVLLSGAVFDEIIVSTFPPGASHWLGLDVPQRVARAHPWIPVSHVVAEPARVT